MTSMGGNAVGVAGTNWREEPTKPGAGKIGTGTVAGASETVNGGSGGISRFNMARVFCKHFRKLASYSSIPLS